MEEVYSGYEKPELNEDEKKQLDSLYKDLDNLYNVITPSKEDLVRGEQIYKKRAELIDLYEQIKPQEKDSYAQDVKVIQELNTISNQIDNNLNLEGDDPLYFKKRDKLLELLEELAKEKKKPDLESTSLDSLYNRLKYEDKEKVEETQDNTSMDFKLPSKEQLLKAESLFEKKDEIYSKLRENSNNFF